MKNLLHILKEIDDTVDWENEQALIDDHILDSFGVITLVSELEDAYSIEIEAVDLIPENFNSVVSIWELVTKLQEK